MRIDPVNGRIGRKAGEIGKNLLLLAQFPLD
jgi:hypothetical protein